MTQIIDNNNTAPKTKNAPLVSSPWSKVAAKALSELSNKKPLEPLQPPPVPANEDIPKNSILDKPPTLKEVPDSKLFSLIHADPIAKSSHLEGGNTLENLDYFKKYLQHYLKTHSPDPDTAAKIKELLNLIEKTQKIGNDTQKIMSEIGNLKKGESFLMAGGYAGKPGHALLYKFTRRENGNYDLFIYNTGEGLEFHPSQGVGNKERYCSVEVFEDVLPEAFCLSSDSDKWYPDLIKRLVDFKNWSGKHTLKSEDIYKGIFGHLAKKRTVVLRSDGDLTSSMRSGMCSWEVLTRSLLRYELNDLEAYKKLEATLKFETTHAYYANAIIPGDTPYADEQRIILRTTATCQLRRLAKEYDPKSPECVTRYATLRDLQMRLDEIEEKVRAERLKKTQKMDWAPKEVRNSHTVVEELSGQVEPFRTQPTKIRTDDPQFPDQLFEPDSFFQKSLNLAAMQLKGLHKISQAILIERTADGFPDMTEVFWDNIPEKDLPKCMQTLYDLLEQYAKLVTQPRAMHPHQQNCALALFAALHRISIRLDKLQKGSLDAYGIEMFPFLNQLKTERYVLFYDPPAFKKQMKLLAYFSAQGKGKKALFNFEKYDHINMGQIVNFAEYELLKKIASDDEAVKKAFEVKFDKKQKKHPKTPSQVVEAATLISSPQIFENTPFQHIGFLMKAAPLCDLFGGYTSYTVNSTPELKIKLKSTYSEVILKVTHSFHYESSWPSSYSNPNATDFQREKEKEELKKLVTSDYFERDHETGELREADLLIEYGKHWSPQKIDFDRLLACVNCEPSLQPAKVLHYFREHLSHLALPDSQSLFDLLFFKPHLEKEEWSIPLFDELSNPSLLKQIDELIKQGLNLFYEKQPGAKPDVYACLFFMRLASRIHSIVPNAPLINPVPLLNRWLQEPDLNAEELSALHLHRLTAYRSTKKTFSEAELSEILESWLYFSQQPLKPEWREPDLEQKARQFIHELKPQFDTLLKDPKRATPFFNGLMLKCGIHDFSNSPSKEWRVTQFPEYRIDLSDNIYFHINILSGQISSDAGPVRLGSTDEINKRALYNRLFGTERFLTRQSGEFLLFVHPHWGSIRIRLGDEIVIYRALEEGKWAQFLPPSYMKKSENELPLAVLADHAHFVPIDDPNVILAEPLSPSAKKTSRIYRDEIIQTSEEKHQRLARYNNRDISHFEEELATYVQVESEGETLYLPRYTSQSGKTLRFLFNEQNQPVFAENRAYHLPKEQRKGLLGTLPNYLYLKDAKNGREKILVPMRPALPHNEMHKPVTHWQTLDVIDQSRKSEYESSSWGKIGQAQKGSYLFLEYDVVQNGARDVITASSQEGTLYLCYLSLIQRDYAKALYYLREISDADALSPTSIQLFSWIFQAGDSTTDETAVNAAIKLHAYLLLKKIEMRPDMQGRIPKDFVHPKTLKAWTACAQDGLSLIPSEIALSEQQLQTLGISRNLSGNGPGKEFANAWVISPFNPPSPITVDILKICSTSKPTDRKKDNYWTEYFEYTQLLSRTNLLVYSSAYSGTNSLIGNFGHFYQAAKSVKTVPEAISLCTRIELCRQMAELENNNKEHTLDFRIAQTLIEFALYYPHLAPDLPDNNSNADEAYVWLQKACTLYQDALKSHNRRFTGSVNPLLNVTKAKTEPKPTTYKAHTLEQQVKGLQLDPSEVLGPINLLQGTLAEQQGFQSYVGTFFNGVALHSEDPEIDPSKIEIRAEDLPETERRYLKAIQEEITHFFKVELPKGIEQNKLRREYSLKDPKGLETIRQQLLNGDGKFLGIQKTKEQLAQIRTILLNLVAKPPQEDAERFLQRLLEGGEAIASSELEELINAWMTQNPASYQKINPRLNGQEIEQIDQLLTVYLEYATNLKQASRALALIEEADSKPRDELEHELATILSEGGHFTPQTDRILRVIEYRAGIRLREKQVTLIKNLRKLDTSDTRFKHAISQMMMGEGKTSVVAAVLLIDSIMREEKQLKKLKTLPVFFGPVAQFETLRRNLSLSQRTYFGQRVVPIALSRAEMTLPNLQWVANQVKEATDTGAALLVRPDTLPGLQLEAFSLLRKMRKAEDSSLKPEILDKVLLIYEILDSAGVDTDSILDELDLLLDPRVEMNFPDDPPENIEDHYTELTKHLFKLMLDERILTEDKQSIKKLLDLRNPHRTFNESEFYQKILPALARALSQYAPLQVKDPDAFVRYITGKMDPKKLSTQDKEFLVDLKKREKSEDADLYLSGLLISTSKYICTKIFKSVLGYDVGKNFGRNIVKSTAENAEKDQMSLKIVIFEGTDSPTQNLFGNYFETMCCHYLAAVAIAEKKDLKICGIHEEQVREFVRQLRISAEHYVEKYDEMFDETAEAKECLAITGIPLSDILKGNNLQKATATINQDIDKILLVETETIKTEVSYFPHYFGSNSHTFFELLRRKKGHSGSLRTMSGTPWNLPSYPADLFENFLPDVGVEGQIAHVELLRGAKNKNWLHEINHISVKGFLDASLKNNPGVCAIADSASFFRKSDNLDVALELQDYFKDREDIETILFFGRKKTGPNEPETGPDYLYMLKKGSKNPIYVGSTAETELKKHGINPETCFVYYDHRHCEATDIPLKKNGVVLKTDNSVKGFLDASLKNNPRVCAIADSASFFRKSDNLGVALELQDYFKDREDIETILFFGRKKTGPNEPKTRPDYLYMLKKGSKKPIYVGSTAKTELKKHGINPETSFVYYDDRHCEATDIPLKKKGVVLKTNNKKEISRTRFQTDLRARGFFARQEVETVVKSDEKDSFMFGGKTPLDHLITALKNQAVRKSEDAYRSLRHAIAAVPYIFVTQKLKDNRKNPERLIEYSHAYEEIIRTKTQVKPYEQFAPLEEEIDALKAIQEYASHHLNLFKKLNLNPDDQEEVENEINKLIKEGTSSPYFPQTIFTSLSDQMETEQQVEFHQDVQQEVQVELEVELEQDMQQELKRYMDLTYNWPVNEKNWEDKDVESQKFGSSLDVRPFAAHMKECEDYQHPYHQIFEGCLLASSNFALSTDIRLPIFHRSQKPGHQILIMRTPEGPKLLLLSIHEAAFFKDYLARKKNLNMWLILSSGDEVSSHKHAELTPEEKVTFKEGMLQVHFLNGNVHALDKNEDDAIQFISEKDSELKMRYLKLRVEKDKEQRRILYRSALLPSNDRERVHLVTHSFRIDYESKRKKQTSSLTQDKIATISPTQVQSLNSYQIKFLKTREQLQKLKPDMVKYVTPGQVPLLPPNFITHLEHPNQINQVPPEHYPLLKQNQLRMLLGVNIVNVPANRIPDLILGQVPFVPTAKVLYLTAPQVQKVTAAQVPYLSTDKFALLQTEEQVQAIPLDHFDKIADDQIRLLGKHQIDLVPPNKIRNISKNQVQWLTRADQIKEIRDDYIDELSEAGIKLLENQRVKHVKNKIKQLTNEQVKFLEPDQIKEVTAEQVEHLESKMLPHLKHDFQIRAVKPELVHLLPPEHARHFTSVQIPKATQMQIPHLVGDQIKSITPEQFPYLNEKQLPYTPAQFVPKLTDNQIKNLLHPEQIQAVPLEKTHLIPDTMVKFLSKEQISRATRQQLQHLEKAQVPHLAPHQVPDLPDELVKAITEEQIPYATNAQLKFLEKDQVPHVSVDRVPDLTERQIEWITSDQVPGLTAAQFPFLKTWRYNELAPHQVPLVDLWNVYTLHPFQLEHLSDRQIAVLDPDSVQHLPDSKLAALSRIEQMKTLDPRRVTFLTRNQLKMLYPKLLERLVLIWTGFLYWIARLIATIAGYYLMVKCNKALKPGLDQIEEGSWRFWTGLKALC